MQIQVIYINATVLRGSLFLLFVLLNVLAQAQEEPVKLSYTGSSTIANFIKDAEPVFQKVQFELDTEPESAGGEQAIINNTTDIAGVARVPNPEVEAAGVQSTLIGRDIIAVVLNEKNPVDDLSKAQLRDIFTGKVTNWRELGGKDLAIHPYIVGTESATREVFRSAIMESADYQSCEVISPDVQVLIKVRDYEGGIGQISASFLKGVAFVYVNEFIKLAAVDGQKPTNTNVNYPINRPLYLLWREGNSNVKEFIDWSESREGQYIVEQHFIGNGKWSAQSEATTTDSFGSGDKEGFLSTLLRYSKAIPEDLKGNKALMIDIEKDTTAGEEKKGLLGRMVRYTISIPGEVFEFSKSIPSKIAGTVVSKEREPETAPPEGLDEKKPQSASKWETELSLTRQMLAKANSDAETIRKSAREEADEMLAVAKLSLQNERIKMLDEAAKQVAEERIKLTQLDASESADKEYAQVQLDFLNSQKTLERARESLELDRMKAKTEGDRRLILEKETQINAKEKELLTAYIQSQEQRRKIDSAQKKIDLQTARMKNQNIIILSSIAGLLLVIGFLAVLFRNFRAKKRVNKILERQNVEIATKNSEITDSINYASKIQEAILPMIEETKRVLPDSFILFKPKDIISGDFYWIIERDGLVMFATADCTGHGVPGALMSMISISLLNESVNAKGILKPDKILEDVRLGIIKALKQTGEIGEQKDGMDVALCCWNKEKRTLSYAGANSPIYIVRNKGVDLISRNGTSLEPELRSNGTALYEIKPDRQPVSILLGDLKPFTFNEFELQEGDVVYCTSDGYQDQFGGDKGKKFMVKRFKQLLIDMQHLELEDQKVHLDETIENWKDPGGNGVDSYEQIDDICVMGIRV